MPKVKYPTEWAYGIPRGGISDRKTSLMLIMRPYPKEGAVVESFNIEKYGSKEACMEHVIKVRQQKSHGFGLTRNEIRFIDADTIEVQLTQGKTFITDAKFINIVNKYPLQAKAKKEKQGEETIIRYYVMAQDKKKVLKFADVMELGYKIVQYKNTDTLDLQEENLREFGIGKKIKLDNDIDDDDPNIIEDTAKYYHMKIEDLPRNKWILGSVIGTIFSREYEKDEVITMRLTDNDNKGHSKTFRINNYDSDDHAMAEVKKYAICVAHSMDIVKNKIRINDDNTIEIMLNNDYITKTNLCYLPLFIPDPDTLQAKITIGWGRSKGSDKIYASITIAHTEITIPFHQLIMGTPMIDHINGDSLDNRLENLRITDYSHNGQNRKDHTGVRTQNLHGKNRFISKIQTRGKKFSKIYSNKKLALKYRKNILEINGKIDADWSDLLIDENDLPALKNSYERTKEYRDDLRQRMDWIDDEYLFAFDDVEPEQKREMFDTYFVEQMYQNIQLTERLKRLKKLIAEFE